MEEEVREWRRIRIETFLPPLLLIIIIPFTLLFLLFLLFLPILPILLILALLLVATVMSAKVGELLLGR